MSVSALLGNPKPQFFISGLPASGYRLFFYAAGTSTKHDTYTDSTAVTVNTNPIVLDAEGYPTGNVMIYGTDNIGYKVVLAPPGSDDPPTSPQWTIDKIYTTASGIVQTGTTVVNFTATTGQTLFSLPPGTTYGIGNNSLEIYLGNGAAGGRLRLTEGQDYTETSNTTFTLSYGTVEGDRITAVIGQVLASPSTLAASSVIFTNGENVQDVIFNTDRIINLVIDYDADNTGATSSSTAFNDALVSLPSTGGAIFLPDGIYTLDTKITTAKHGIRIIGESQSGVIIRPAVGYTDTYLIDFGDGINSKYHNEISYLTLDDNNSVGSIIGIRYNRINNNSSIHHCTFNDDIKGIEFDNLAISNHIHDCRFFPNTDSQTVVELIGSAGNSTIFGPGNYLNGGVFYLNNSMNHVIIADNIFDASATIFSDGVSGQRGLKIRGNRLEMTSNVIPIELGLNRGCTINENIFVGNSSANIAIQLDSTSNVQQVGIRNNSFETFNTSYVVSSLPAGLLSLVDNRHDGSATTPYNTNVVETKIKNIANDEDNKIGIKEDTLTFGAGNNVIEYTFEKQSPLATTTDLFSITTVSGERGSYTCIIEGLIDFTPNSSAVAAMGVKYVFPHINDNGGVATDGAVTEVYETASVADAPGTRDITGNTCAVTTTSNTVSTVNFTITGTGTTNPIARLRITIIHNTYSTDPVVVKV